MELLQSHNVTCPYCGEMIDILVDTSIAEQEYIEDCQVCCRPISFKTNVIDNHVTLNVKHEND